MDGDLGGGREEGEGEEGDDEGDGEGMEHGGLDVINELSTLEQWTQGGGISIFGVYLRCRIGEGLFMALAGI